MRRFLRENSLSIVFLLLFLAALCGQAIAGHAEFNDACGRATATRTSRWPATSCRPTSAAR